ncbi:chemotaxis protein [Vibrio albus]|uniref:Chemotaxis protein n=1 Tax=Vibrio albus TaxID=2200953 RepID=A0A2U3B940_9VIBR|nr:methyl-accepting chemotaxis protein [Vibrio albus]PWI33298.1 chemotaxis protein [Vibrio albus]
MKFSHKIVAASSVLLLITISLLSAKQFFTVQSEMNHTINESISDIVNGVRNTVTAELNNKKALARYSTTLAEQNPSREHITEVISQPELSDTFLLVGGGFEEDGAYFTGDPSWIPSSDWDPRKRPWYKDAKSQGSLIITDPYPDSVTKDILVSIATPLTREGRFIGSIFYDMSLSSLSELVNNVKLFNAGYLFIVAKDGTVIAHPDSELNGKKMDSFLPSIQIRENQYQNVTLKDGMDYTLNYAKIEGQDWYVGVLLNEKEAFQSVYDIRNNSIIYSLLGLIVSIVILLFVIRKLMAPLGDLNTAIKDVASGHADLTKRLGTDTDQEFAELASGFNTFSENLQGQITQLKAISQEILRGTETTAKGAASSADAMSTQLQELEQLATAMNEMATTASDVAHNAQGAAAAAQEADDATQIGAEIVSETTTSIDTLSAQIEHAVSEVQKLEDATNSIETVLQVINDIADQTNLLALNAAIEAARAGEQGRGFAVVADEVRTLAQRTQESTTEIRSMIEQLQAGATAVATTMNESKNAAAGTVEKAQQADESLQRIFEAIRRITDMNLQIASAAEQQSLVAEEINANTLKIKDLSVQVSDESQQTNTAMQVQTENVRDQNSVLDKFIV